MKRSISLRSGSLYIVIFAALLASTAVFASGDPVHTAGPRGTIVMRHNPTAAPKAQLASLNVDPADLERVQPATKECTFRAGPRETICCR